MSLMTVKNSHSFVELHLVVAWYSTLLLLITFSPSFDIFICSLEICFKWIWLQTDLAVCVLVDVRWPCVLDLDLCRLNGHMSSYIVPKPDADTGNISDGSEQEEEISPTFSKSSGSLSCLPV